MNAKILLVDDDPSLLKSSETLLTMQGMEVTPVNNVPEALKEIVLGEYDALVTDLHMPGPADGLTLATAMHHSQPEAATVVVSSLPDMDTAAQALVNQVDEILVKPFGSKELVGLIEDHVNDRRS
jgi:DNA-binding NtrC family response regulator